MSFGFANTGSSLGASSNAVVKAGPELPTIQTEDLGFLSVAGDAKLRLTSSWSPLPNTSASLLSIASRKGLVAAAGPDQITIATTESCRKGLEAPKNGESDIRSFEPQLNLPMPMRISQLAFTADENYLILSAESGGGLAVYEVASLLSGSTNSAFELSTNGESLRTLAPNPTPEKAELCAIVTTDGNLHMANLKERSISNPIRSQVSCVSWSAKGKQLCAGTADGSIHQMTPDGEAKGEISSPPNVQNHHVSSLTWLENHLWLAIHTSSNESAPSSIYHIITREPPSNFTFQKIADPVEPFGSDKTPHHSVLRVRDFPPDLQDLLVISSTASTDLGLLSRSKKALATDQAAASITGVFTMTELLDDTKRPTLPMTDSMDDSVPVGVALDLSSKDKVYKPIPSDEELEESATPLPGLWVLTHEGILCPWWLVYTDSVKQKTAYPGLATADSSPFAPTATVSTPAAPFSSTGGSAFGALSTTAPAFGAASQMGAKSSPWGTSNTTSTPTQAGGAAFGSSTFGSTPSPAAPAFGKPSAPSFGQSSQIGIRTSPWSTAASSTPAFGQSGFASFSKKDNASPFGNAAPTPSQPAGSSSGGFAGFANSSGFASVGGDNKGQSVFGGGDNKGSSAFSGGAQQTSSVFGSNNNNSGSSVFGAASNSQPAANPFGAVSKETAFPAPSGDKSSAGLFSSQPFKLQSSFKPDPSAKDDNEKPSGSLFGSAFGSALQAGNAKTATTITAAKDEDMDSVVSNEQSTEQAAAAKPQASSLFGTQRSTESTTPTSTPAPSKFMNVASPSPQSSIFGQPTPGLSTPGLFNSKPTNSTFGAPSTGSGFSFFNKKPEDKPAEPETPKSSFDDAPLPPDTTSRSAYPIGDSSSSSAASKAPSLVFPSSKAEDAPLPPDPSATPRPGSTKESEAAAVPDAPLPPDFTKASKPKETTEAPEAAPLPPDFVKRESEDAPLPLDFTKPSQSSLPSAPPPPDPTPAMKKSSGPSFTFPPVNDADFEDDDSDDDDDEDEDEDEDDGGSEGSGVDVAKEMSPSTVGLSPTPGYTPQSSFKGRTSTTPATQTQDKTRPLFGELSRPPPMFPQPSAGSPRSPSPIRRAVPDRVLRSEASRSVSAPGMASQILGPNKSQSPFGSSAIAGNNQTKQAEDSFLAQHRKLKERQEAQETKPLVDEEYEEIQKILSSEVEGALQLDQFLAHTNVAPPAQESIPAQVEAVYRDINSMIDTVGLNSRSVKSFIKGHTDSAKEDGRAKDDLEIPDDWVLCEVDALGQVLDDEVFPDLEDGRVLDLEGQLEAFEELRKDVHRLFAKQRGLKKIIMVHTDSSENDNIRSLPLSTEQTAQQNELRREFTNFSKLLAQVEEALTMLKIKIASASGPGVKARANAPTIEAVVRTITKMTAMAEKRSGDVDHLENQLRSLRLEGSMIRDGSPSTTPTARRSVMFSPDTTPMRNPRHSFMSSVTSFGGSFRGSMPPRTPPRKKLSNFSVEEKTELRDRKAKRQAMLTKLKEDVSKKGVQVWNMEDIE